MTMNWPEGLHPADGPGRPRPRPVFAAQKLVVAGGTVQAPAQDG
jgi:hypothetical protein